VLKTGVVVVSAGVVVASTVVPSVVVVTCDAVVSTVVETVDVVADVVMAVIPEQQRYRCNIGLAHEFSYLQAIALRILR